MKETLKRTNTPNFRKNFVHEPKFFEEDGSMDHESDDDNKNHETNKKPLMKVPTFSRNITNQTNNKKSQPKTSSFVVEPVEIHSKPVISLNTKDDDKNIKFHKDEKDTEIGQPLINSGQQSPQRTRFFQNSKSKEGQSHSPKDLVLNQVPLKTVNSSGSNPESRSPSNQTLRNPSNPQIENLGKSLDKICEEESELASSEKKKSRKPSILTNVTSTAPTKMSLRNSPKEIKEIKLPTNNFKMNLIDFFRNEPPQTTNQMTTSVFSRNSKKTFQQTRNPHKA